MIHYMTTEGVGNAWVANELRELDRAEIPYVLHAMRSPPNRFHASAWSDQMHRQTRVLYPLPVFGTALSVVVAPFRFGRRFFAALGNALFGERENLRARAAAIAHFFVACHWARTLRQQPVSHIHAQWAHSCATIAMYGAWLLETSFSFTGHACDLYRDRVALGDKIRRAEFIVCISTFHQQFYLDQGARPEQLLVVYCGIDPTLFAPQPRDGVPTGPWRILAAGRLVEKKGFRYLIDACPMLVERAIDLECTIGGSGPLEAPLRDQVQRLGLADRVTITGRPIKQEELPRFMHTGDVFCLPCVWAADGDVDGLPQMLMEAMACGVPVVSTSLVGIPDLVIDEQTGLLVEPNDAVALAAALARLAEDEELRRRLAQAGRQAIIDQFDIRQCLAPLLEGVSTAIASARAGELHRNARWRSTLASLFHRVAAVDREGVVPTGGSLPARREGIWRGADEIPSGLLKSTVQAGSSKELL